MKRTILIILLGFMGACVAHFGWFYLRRPANFNESNSDISWMRTELNLSDEQFMRIKTIHETSAPRMLALAAQVSKMRSELDAFERERKSEGQIDFIEFARFVESRRAIDRECINSTRQLVLATAQVMTPQQRERYLGLVSPAMGGSSPKLF